MPNQQNITQLLNKSSICRIPAVVRSTGIARSRQDLQIPDITYGLGTQSCMRLFKTYYKIFEFRKNDGEKHPVCCMANEDLMSDQWANMSRKTFYKCKEKLMHSRLIECIAQDTYQRGKIAFVYPTEEGWAKYHKIKADRLKKQVEKIKKAPVLEYTEQDMENAKFWYKCLRRFWKDSAGKLKQIGAWEVQKEVRANAARKAREMMDISAQDFLDILEQIANCKDAEFYFKNVLGPKTFNKKWKNGLTAAESMRTHCEEIAKEKSIQANLTISRNDVPVFLDASENKQENPEVSKVWNAMWDIIGEKLRTKFKTEYDSNKYLQALYAVCDNLEDIVHSLDVQPGQIYLKDSGLRQDLANDNEPSYSSYFYYLLDKYRAWEGFFSIQMLLEPWMAFWRKVWKINHGEPTEQDMEQFELNMPA